eukprot:6356138-Lingulodinium_polyedra.AAC.1
MAGATMAKLVGHEVRAGRQQLGPNRELRAENARGQTQTHNIGAAAAPRKQDLFPEARKFD